MKIGGNLIGKAIVLANEDLYTPAAHNVRLQSNPCTHPLILNNLDDAGQNSPSAVNQFFGLLRCVPTGPDAQAVDESLTDDFAMFIMSCLLDFPPGLGIVAHRNQRRRFSMGGERVYATPDIELWASEERILLIQENKVRVFPLSTAMHP